MPLPYTPTYILRPMALTDINMVMEVDRLSFASPWSARSYAFEITENPTSYMIVIEQMIENPPQNGGSGGVPPVVGYGGMWLIEGEAHISTIAVHPEQRGKGLGEALLVGMLGRAILTGAQIAMLEVRVSNEAAIRLYLKYQFEIIGRRRGYYRDNNEDAYLMNLSPLNVEYSVRFAERVAALRARLSFADRL